MLTEWAERGAGADSPGSALAVGSWGQRVHSRQQGRSTICHLPCLARPKEVTAPTPGNLPSAGSLTDTVTLSHRVVKRTE